MEAQGQFNLQGQKRIQWAARGYDLLKKRQKIMLTTEIVFSILKSENIQIGDHKRSHLNALSTALRNLVKDGVLKQAAKIGFNTAIYGLPEWFDESGNIKQEYDVEYFQD